MLTDEEYASMPQSRDAANPTPAWVGIPDYRQGRITFGLVNLPQGMPRWVWRYGSYTAWMYWTKGNRRAAYGLARRQWGQAWLMRWWPPYRWAKVGAYERIRQSGRQCWQDIQAALRQRQ